MAPPHYRDTLTEAARLKRPILHHGESFRYVNCSRLLTSPVTNDSCWLLQIPLPTGGWFNILLDSFLGIEAVSTFRWWLVQTATVPPAYTSIAQIQELCEQSGGKLDLLVITHFNEDHCHPPTLLAADPTIPVIAGPGAYPVLKKWKHFDSVSAIPPFTAEGKHNSPPCFPDWLGIGWIAMAPIYNDTTLMITFDLNDGPETVIYSIHGMTQERLDSVKSMKVSTVIHPLVESTAFWGRFPTQGAHEGLVAFRTLKPKYWVRNHGGTTFTGFMSNVIVEVRRTIQDALNQEAGVEVRDVEEAIARGHKGQLVDLDNGLAMILR